MLQEKKDAFMAGTAYQKMRKHFTENKDRYVVGVVVAGITVGIMRAVGSQPISVDIVDAAGGAIGVAGKRVVMNNVSFISANRQGSPSWVIRCLETDEVFTSQRKAAIAMGLSQANLSQHLNQVRDHVNDLHFERIALAG
jgi:hypothetical protein